MQASSERHLDQQLSSSFERVGVIGNHLRNSLSHEFKAKILVRGGRAPVEITGLPGVGKHTIAEAAHAVACDVLGRRDHTVRLDCEQQNDLESSLREAIEQAEGGTLVLERFGALDERTRAATHRMLESNDRDALVLALHRAEDVTAKPQASLGTRIDVKPLHQREEDIWELVDHFFEALATDHDLGECRGFSRQAKADLATTVQQTNLASVRRLREIVHDVVFQLAAAETLPLKLTSAQVRPWLEAHAGLTPDARDARDSALLESQFDAVASRSLAERLAGIHGVPVDLMERQAEVLREIIGYIDDVPRSYRNIMDRAEDIQRAALWLVTGASTQARFRKFFGEQRFMRPTKSVAWAFYNRVFKRDMG